MKKIPDWIKENGTLFYEDIFEDRFAAVYAPHLNKQFPWCFYCYEGRLSGDYRCYKTQADAEDQLNKRIANTGGILLEKESL